MISLARELFAYMGARKKWWLLPMLLVLLRAERVSMRLLGVSAFYHDSAAALVEDGRIVAAAQEERFTRKKHDAAFPAHAIRYCLEAGKVDLDGIDHVVFFEKPLIKFERLIETKSVLGKNRRQPAKHQGGVSLWARY
jgi:predicted NodU family carbamoyl transferase